jgi:hypothetical protein
MISEAAGGFAKGRWLAALSQTIGFRLLVAAALLAAHFWTFLGFARERFDAPFNKAPGNPPVFVSPGIEQVTATWDRLVFSRWDSAHYISLLERGYSQCPTQDLRDASPGFMHCNFNFYPGYPAFTWLINRALHLPADYALLLVSLVSSFVFLFLWTDRMMVRALGVGTVYASLIAFNVFPTGFTLVTLQTEPLCLVFTLAAFLALARGRWLLGAIFAGTASAMRLNAAAVSVAMALAIAVALWKSPPKRWTGFIVPAISMVVSGWGVLAITGYHWLRYKDPLLYVHAHAETYGHTTSLLAVFDPKPEWLLRSIDHPLHEGVVCLLALVFFLLGRREAMGGFTLVERVFWYTLSLLCVGVTVVGSISLGLSGMNRYLLLVFPVFFAIGVVIKKRPALFVVWVLVSFWQYRQGDLCDYIGGVGDARFPKCNVGQWMGHW